MSSEIDYTLDRIGERLAHPEREPILAADDRVRVEWILSKGDFAGPVVDVGASDGTIAQMWRDKFGTPVWMVEAHPAHRAALVARDAWIFPGAAADALRQVTDRFFETGLLCEVMEHYSKGDAIALYRLMRRKCKRVIVTVPNMNCESYVASGRARRDWPDHRSQWNRIDVFGLSGWDPEPIVGTLDDSIWLGAVCE